MTRAIAALLSLWLTLASLATPVHAERRVALVIGNSAYQAVSKLPNPANDATDIAATLARVGFTVREQTDLDFNGIRRALRDFGDEAAGADMALIFFAGHGLEIDKRNYVVPVDALLRTDRDIPHEAIPLDHLLSAVEAARGLRLVLLDACRNNPFAASMRMTSATRSIGRGLSPIDPGGGVVVGFAAKEGTTADDGQGRNSPYTAALLAHLEEPGLEIRLLLGKVRDRVLAATGRLQEPFLYGSLGGEEIYLVPPRAGQRTDDPLARGRAEQLARREEELKRREAALARQEEVRKATEASEQVVTFDKLKPGPLSVDALASSGMQLVLGKGAPGVYKSERNMVLPAGRNQVLLVGGDRVTSLAITFNAPIRRFSLTRIGTAGGASVPTWTLHAYDIEGKVIDSTGEEHGLPPEPRQVSVEGSGIVRVQLSTDNRFGDTAWATWNSLPVAQFKITR